MMVAKNCLEKDKGSETKNRITLNKKYNYTEPFPNLYKTTERGFKYNNVFSVL